MSEKLKEMKDAVFSGQGGKLDLIGAATVLSDLAHRIMMARIRLHQIRANVSCQVVSKRVHKLPVKCWARARI